MPLNDVEFDKDYSKNAHCQQSFNDETIANIASIISEYFPSKQALNILDLCCGNGEPTFKLLKALESKEVQVNEIIGYDISPEQIEIANSRYVDKKLKFKVQDIEEMKDEDSYHVVISLFGLHWIKDVKNVAHKIHQASKTSALVYFFMPLEKMDLFHIRSKSIKKYSDFFGDYSIEPFIEKSFSYTKAFKNYFSLSDRRFSGMREMINTEEQFKQFLLSWLPEVRYFKKNKKDEGRYIIEDYLKRLIELLPENEGIKAIAEIENGNIVSNKQFNSPKIKLSQKEINKNFYYSLKKSSFGVVTTIGLLVAAYAMVPSIIGTIVFCVLAFIVLSCTALHIKNSTIPSYREMKEMNFEDDIFISKFRGEDSIYKIKFTERFFCFVGYKKELKLPPNSFLYASVIEQNKESIAI